MNIWHVSWGYGELVTMAESREDAIEKFRRSNFTFVSSLLSPESVCEQMDDVAYYGVQP